MSLWHGEPPKQQPQSISGCLKQTLNTPRKIVE